MGFKPSTNAEQLGALANNSLKKIVAFGDSITHGTDGTSYPSIIEAFTNRSVINLGVDGDTTQDLLDRFDEVISEAPGIVLLMVGTNDSKSTEEQLNVVKSNYNELVTKIKALGAIPICASIMPDAVTDATTQKNIKLNIWIKNYCMDNGIDFVDIFSNFVSNGSVAVDLFLDAKHPLAQGHLLNAESFIEALEKHINILVYNYNQVENNLFDNGAFLLDSNADGRADGVSQYINGTTVLTNTLIDSPEYGKQQQCSRTTGEWYSVASLYPITGVDSIGEGDIIEVEATFDTDGLNGNALDYSIHFITNSYGEISVERSALGNAFKGDLKNKRIRIVGTAPTGAQRLYVTMNQTGANASNMRMSLLSIRKL